MQAMHKHHKIGWTVHDFGGKRMSKLRGLSQGVCLRLLDRRDVWSPDERKKHMPNFWPSDLPPISLWAISEVVVVGFSTPDHGKKYQKT
jgi:hypothetical protein